jgi:hypothetical protein
MTMVNVVFGWTRVQAVLYLVLSIAMAYQVCRWSPHLIRWMNWLKSAAAMSIVWAALCLVLLEFHPGISAGGAYKGEEQVLAAVADSLPCRGRTPADRAAAPELALADNALILPSMCYYSLMPLKAHPA